MGSRDHDLASVECGLHSREKCCTSPSESARLTHHRVRQLKEEPYSQKEAEAAVGITVDNGKRATEEEMVDADDVAEAT